MFITRSYWCRYSSHACTVLAIESSCDDTAVCLFSHPSRHVIYHRVLGQDTLHIPYGGIVPQLAAQRHRVHLPILLKEASQALAENGSKPVGLVAVTQGPGLASALSVGLAAGQLLSSWLRTPLIGMHHMEAHLLVPLWESSQQAEGIQFPFLSLLVTGGHTLLVLVKQIGSYKILGETLDDALGEALDKGARTLAIPWQVGDGSPAQSMESFIKAGDGNPLAFQFRLPFKKPKHFAKAAESAPSCHFSFSGFKTALNTTVGSLSLLAEAQTGAALNDKLRVDLAASYQHALFSHVVDRLKNVSLSGIKDLVVSGGVARNATLLSMLEAFCQPRDLQLWRPGRKDLCTDNALMIAFAASERLNAGLITLDSEHRAAAALEARPKWSIEHIDTNALY